MRPNLSAALLGESSGESIDSPELLLVEEVLPGSWWLQFGVTGEDPRGALESARDVIEAALKGEALAVELPPFPNSATVASF